MKFLVFAEQTLTLIFWILIIFGFDSPKAAALTVLAAVIHEAGHIIAIRATRRKSSVLPQAKISGFRINIPTLSYKDELICAIAGPLINLIAAAICVLFFKSESAVLFGALNAMTAVSNLLLVKGYDGYRAAQCTVLLLASDAARGEAILEWISFLLSCILCFFSLYLLLRLGEGYWIFFLFFSVLLTEIIGREK